MDCIQRKCIIIAEEVLTLMGGDLFCKLIIEGISVLNWGEILPIKSLVVRFLFLEPPRDNSMRKCFVCLCKYTSVKNSILKVTYFLLGAVKSSILKVYYF